MPRNKMSKHFFSLDQMLYFVLRLMLYIYPGSFIILGPSWSWSYTHGSWIYKYLCNQWQSPLMWVRISIRVRYATLCDKVCQWLTTGQWFTPRSSINKTDCHDINEILLKVALNNIKQTKLYHILSCNVGHCGFLA